MINSKRKGKVAELAFSALCKSYGYNTRRTAQYCGNTGQAGDVEGLPGIHIEVKAQERLNLRDAMAQSVRDCEMESKGNIPIVAHKKNNSDWLVTMKANDFFEIYREWEAGRN